MTPAQLIRHATVRNVSASTQNQALNALVFLYGEVLHQPLVEIGEYARAQRPQPMTTEYLFQVSLVRVVA